MGTTVTKAPPQHQPQPQPGHQPGAPAAPDAHNDAGARQATVMRLLNKIPLTWRTLCGSLLGDTDPPATPYPDVKVFRTDAYNLMAKPDKSGLVGVQEVAGVLELFPTRKAHYDALLDVDKSFGGDRRARTTIIDCLENLEQGGEITENTERLMAAAGMLSNLGREWLHTHPDAKAPIESFRAYVNDVHRIYVHANYGEGTIGAPQRTINRQNALKPLLNLVTVGTLNGQPAVAATGADGAAPPPYTDEEKTQAADVKTYLSPYLPHDGVENDKPEKKPQQQTRRDILKKLHAIPDRVRELVFSDTAFMRRIAMLGDQNLQTDLLKELDPIEKLWEHVSGFVHNRPTGSKQGSSLTKSVSTDEKFNLIKDYLLSHPGDENTATRMRVMSHPNLSGTIRGFADDKQRELWRAATRGSLAPTAEDQLWAAVRNNKGDEVARICLAVGGKERERMRALQDDLMFRSAMESEKMRAEVEVDGVKVRPYNLILLMWGQRPGATHDPGAKGPVEDNPESDDRPLTVDERRKLDGELYDPTVERLSKHLASADIGWAWAAEAITDDSDTVDCLEAFRQKCADESTYRPLIRRGGQPPGQVLSERFNRRTGKNIRELISRGLSADYRRRAETALQVTIDHASVGTVGNQFTRNGDRPKDASIGLDQALGETRVADGRTVSQVVHQSAKTLKNELHESEFWNGGGDVSDCKEIWKKLNEAVTPEIIGSLRTQTKTQVYLIELLANAYQQYDGPLISAMKNGLQKHEQDIIFPLYGVDAASEAKRAEETKTAEKASNPEEAGKEEAETVFGAPARELFPVLADLSTRSDDGAFKTAKEKLGKYRSLRVGASEQPANKNRLMTEIPPDAAVGSKPAFATTPEDYYRLHFGLTPQMHAQQVARSFRRPPAGYNTYRGGEAYHERDPAWVATELGLEASVVSGTVATPTEEPNVDDANVQLVRPGFTRITAEQNASEMWRILHSGGQLHLIQTMLYGPYNDEEQRLIRLAFRRLSGGIDWQFYIQQAKFMRDKGQVGGHADYQAKTDGRSMMVGAEGTDLAKADADKNKYSNNGIVWVVADGGELDAALSVATHGELDIKAELRNACWHDSLTTVFRIMERATPDQCRQIGGDTKLMADLRSKCGGDAADWDRIYRIVMGTDDLTVRLQSRIEGGFFSSNPDEKGMKEDVKAYIKRVRLMIEEDVRKEFAANPNMIPDPQIMASEVRRRMRDALRSLASNSDVQAILKRELEDTDLSTTRDTLMHGEEGNTAQLVGGGDADKVLDEIRRMQPAERARCLQDPEYMQQLSKRLTGAADFTAALELLNSGSAQKQEKAGTDGLADVERWAKKSEVNKCVDALLEMTADDHARLLNDPRLMASVIKCVRHSDKWNLVQKLLSIRPEKAGEELGDKVLYPDAKGKECIGRTLSDGEKQRLAFQKENAIFRIRHGASVSWNQVLRHVIEVYKYDFKPVALVGDAPGLPAPQVSEPGVEPQAPPPDDTKEVAKKISTQIRTDIFAATKKYMDAEFADSSVEVLRMGIMGEEDPSRSRIREQWGVNDDEAGVEETLRKCSDQILVDKWASVKTSKPNGGDSLKDVYWHYRDVFDEVGGEKKESSPEQEKLQQKKLAYMNYVVDVSFQFEDDLLGNAGGWGDDSDSTKWAPDDPRRSRTKTRDNAEYLKWRTMIRDRLPKIPAPLIVGSSRVDLQACKLEYSIVSPK